MIEIKAKRRQGFFSSEIEGHANYAPKGEEDIVCAAVSTLFYTLINGMENWKEKENISLDYGDDEKKAWMTVIFRENDKGVCAVIDVFTMGFLSIQEKYPKNLKFFKKVEFIP